MRLFPGLLLFALGIYIFTLSISDLMRFLFGFSCLAAGFLMIVSATKKRRPKQFAARQPRGAYDKSRDGAGGNGHSNPDGAADSDGGGGSGGGGSGGDGGD